MSLYPLSKFFRLDQSILLALFLVAGDWFRDSIDSPKSCKNIFIVVPQHLVSFINYKSNYIFHLNKPRMRNCGRSHFTGTTSFTLTDCHLSLTCPFQLPILGVYFWDQNKFNVKLIQTIMNEQPLTMWIVDGSVSQEVPSTCPSAIAKRRRGKISLAVILFIGIPKSSNYCWAMKI